MPMTPCLHLTGLEYRPLFKLHGLVWTDDDALQLERLSEGFATAGSFLAGPFSTGEQATAWSSLHLVDGAPDEQTGLRIFSLTSSSDAAPAMPNLQVEDANTLALTPADTWCAHPSGTLEMALLHAPARWLWLAGSVWGDGQASPRLTQARLDYDHNGWGRFLPAIYRRKGAAPDFLEQVLGALESNVAPLEQAIDDLPLLFDPAAVPSGEWLEWLAGWLAFEMDSNWEETTAREALAGAFESYGRRGTPAGLREAIALYTGLEAVIDEPAQQVSLWMLGGDAGLGFGTMLAAAEPGPATLGDTAAAGGSYILPEEHYGAPLYEELAWRFKVRIHSPRLDDPAMVERLRRVIEREKPAHTTWQLCRMENRMRVGIQATVGVDAWVAPAAPPLRTGLGGPLGRESHLSPEPGEPEGSTRLGPDTRLGFATHLT